MVDALIRNENELLIEISRGNEQSFKDLFYAFKSKLYTYALRLTESKEVAEDIVHDVFFKVWLNKEKLPEIDNINAYLFKATHNLALNGFRRKAKETLVLAELEKKLSIQIDNTDNKLVLREVKEFIHSAMGHLTPQQRQVFKLSREEGLKQEEIAQQLNISLFTVKKHLTNALNCLRSEMVKSYQVQVVIALIVVASILILHL
ncbi:RNA polymerase sigma factor [Flavitalea flava]